MWYLLLVLLFGHMHKWNTISEAKLTHINTGAVGTRYICQCEKCGKIVKRDMI